MYMLIFLLTSAVHAVTSDVHYVDLLRGHDLKSEVVSKSTLQVIQLQIIELKKLVEKQQTVLAQLVEGQNKLAKYKSRELRKNKHTRRYLRKIYKSCTCESRSNPAKYYSKVMDDAKGDNSKRMILFDRSKSDDVTKSKNVLLGDSNSIPDEGSMINVRVPQGDGGDATRGLRDSQVVIAPPTQDTSDQNGGDKVLDGLPEDELRPTSTTVQSTSTQSLTTSATTETPVMFGDGSDFNEESYDVFVNLESGKVWGNHSDVIWLHPPSEESSSLCSRQGLARLQFRQPSSNQRHDKIKIDMWFDSPSGWVFNVGDSKSNDGGSGDGTTQENDCEAQGYGASFSIHGSDKSPNPLKKMLYESRDFITSRVTLIVKDETITWDNHHGNANFLQSPALFALNNQSDSQGPVNRDIYLSLNRVIAGTYRSGRGLCNVALKWLE
ncbi:uncharacterized protein LOC124264551 [Haliotis rubra]|uniref:uncharacterized protein LOC124264551 n=1 Tax=Haliotis rubra TaxID=36100 RepID=UPI001EE55544|nr:uncharacterized protein LOC124264551 [Haliotis rubra]